MATLPNNVLAARLRARYPSTMSVDLTPLVIQYPGQWVGLLDDEHTVIASGTTVREVMEQATRRGHKKPILFRVPTKILPYIGGLAGT